MVIGGFTVTTQDYSINYKTRNIIFSELGTSCKCKICVLGTFTLQYFFITKVIYKKIAENLTYFSFLLFFF